MPNVFKSSVQSSALSSDFQASVSMVMAVSSNEKEIANTMLKSVVHMAPPMLVGANRHNSTRKIGIGSIKNEGPQIAAFGFNKRHIPGYIRVAHAAVAFGYNFRI